MIASSRRAVSAWSAWAPSPGSGTTTSTTPSACWSAAVIFIARAAVARLVRRPPQDRRAALRADDRVDRVLEGDDDVADGDRERPARAALAGDDRHDRRPQAAHQPDRAGDRLGDAALLRFGAGMGARARRRTSRPAARTARRAPSPASPCGSPPGGASRSCAGCSRRCRRPSAGRRRRPAGRRSGRSRRRSRRRRRTARSPWSSTKSSAIAATSSSVRGRRRLRASWTRAQTALGVAGPTARSRAVGPVDRRSPRAGPVGRVGRSASADAVADALGLAEPLRERRRNDERAGTTGQPDRVGRRRPAPVARPAR